MNGIWKAVILFALFSAVFVLLVVNIQPAQSLSPDNSNYVAIEDTIKRFESFRAEAQYSGDGSQMGTVLANDSRGGILNENEQKLVRYIKKDPALGPGQIGLLDYYQSLYIYYQLVKNIYDDAINTGKVTVPTPFPYDPSVNPVPLEYQGTEFDRRMQVPKVELLSIPELAELAQVTGILPYIPPKRPKELYVIGFKILSVTIEGDLARAQVDYTYGLVEDMLVNKDGKWYLVGQKVIKWHGG